MGNLKAAPVSLFFPIRLYIKVVMGFKGLVLFSMEE